MTCGAPGRRPFRPSPFPVIQRAETDLNVARGVTSWNLPELPRRPWEAGTSLSCVVPALPRPAAGRVSTRREWTQLRPPPAARPVREPGRQVWGAGPRAGGRARRLDPRTWAVRAMPTPPVRPTTGREGHGELPQPPGRTPSAGGRPCGSPGLPRSLGATRSARITVNTQRRHPPKAGGANAGREPEQRVRTPHGQRGLTCLPAPSPSSGTR